MSVKKSPSMGKPVALNVTVGGKDRVQCQEVIVSFELTIASGIATALRKS